IGQQLDFLCRAGNECFKALLIVAQAIKERRHVGGGDAEPARLDEVISHPITLQAKTDIRPLDRSIATLAAERVAAKADQTLGLRLCHLRDGKSALVGCGTGRRHLRQLWPGPGNSTLSLEKANQCQSLWLAEVEIRHA